MKENMEFLLCIKHYAKYLTDGGSSGEDKPLNK